MSSVYDKHILEQRGRRYQKSLLDVLLWDHAAQHHILWATDDYAAYGSTYEETDEILPEQLSGENRGFIRPRISKASENQFIRTRRKAEVFTPSWICNAQNNLVDAQWFGRENVFNRPVEEDEHHWQHTNGKIAFPDDKAHSWKQYVDARRMEISCGEAPYLVSRYDAVTGDEIPIAERIGILDRKLRIVSENVSDAECLFWTLRAFQSVYGFEYQGDSLFLARENLFASFIEYHFFQFGRMPETLWLYRIATVISWNLWQMDGQKGVVPGSCHTVEYEENSLFGDIVTYPCPGCEHKDIYQHNGIYCVIKDWRAKKKVKFVSLLKGGGARGSI